jgi:hypothetical protein
MFPGPIIAWLEGPLARARVAAPVRKEAAMVWRLLSQQQQRGAQFPAGGRPPKEAVEGRAAQDHEQAAGAPQAGESPAGRLEDREGDNTPTAPEPAVQWDEVVQPPSGHGRRQQQGEERDDLPLPEGK